jgi:sec-independent protein translocase protein TatC
MADTPDQDELPVEESSDTGSFVAPFLEHLEALRWTLVKSFAALGLAMVLCFAFAPQLLSLTMWPLRRIGKDPSEFLRTLEVTGGFALAMKLALYAGIVLAAPFIIYFVGQFILPALNSRELKLVRPVLMGGIGLFLAGAALAFFGVLPAALQFFLEFNNRMNVRSEWLIDNYVGFVAQMVLAFGVCFELPLVILALAKLGIMTLEFMKQKRPYVVVAILVVAAFVTPTTDPFNMALLAVPMYLLYEGCIWITWWNERRRKSETV